ncbi:zinc-dependent metalloproteinase lipoprotein, family [Bacteroidales bacterium Barb7]|nr:zinc-dependent metalloproteinase lipoprotein, family [Bacteroidales bacterium Barb7]
MKLKIILLVFACFYMPFRSFSQKKECGTTLTSDNFDVLRSISTDIIEPLPSNGKIQYVPIKHHIVRKSDETGGISTSTINKIMQELNYIYKEAYVQFYIYNGIDYINSDMYYDFVDSLEESSLIATYNSVKSINIYYFHSVILNFSDVAGYAYLPTGTNTKNFIAIDNESAPNGTTVIHEVGHFFGLLHTHETFYGIELIDGSNGHKAGDICSDTPADPELNYNTVNENCEYIGGQEYKGLKYNPNTHNYMSYSRKECRDEFSNKQLARIYHYSYSAKIQSYDIKTDPSIIYHTFIQNHTFDSGNQTFIDQNIHAGSNITNTLLPGPVVIKNSAIVTFEAKESILLQGEFEVQKGAEFTGKTK